MKFLWPLAMLEKNKYSSLNQEQADESQVGTSGTTFKAGRKQKMLIGSVILNGALLVLVSLLFLEKWPSRVPRRLLASPVPEFPHEIKTFKLDPLYLSLPTNESNEAWERLHGPNGRGFINLDGKDAAINYPDTKAGLSVFHQLHCLGAVRLFIWDLVYGRQDPEQLLRDWPEDVASPTYHAAIHGLWHISHCLDYLRQGVQCSGDTSLEFVTDITGQAVVDGLDWPHQCKKWDAIWEYAEMYG